MLINAEGRLFGRPSRNFFRSYGRAHRGGDPLLQLLLRRGADLARGEFAVLEDHQRRDRHDAVFRRDARVLVDVKLHDLDLVAHLACDLFESRGDHAAWAAPFSPEIDNDRAGCLEHFGFEARVGNFTHAHGAPRFFSNRELSTRGEQGTYGRPPEASRRITGW
jgi:hypothetical protein